MSDFNFESISPSAKSLLISKAQTSIPFAKEAVQLIWGPESLKFGQQRLSSKGFIQRLIHFESRYWSIDTALAEINIKNILEFSSGFSFRGLNMCKDPEVFYVDTDLPEIIELKKNLVQDIAAHYCKYSVDNLYLRAMNVLEEDSFTEMINLLPAGPVAIVNEGLLMYFDEAQKEQLCAIIYNRLKEREGFWITTDIYLKKDTENAIAEDFYEEQGAKFLENHHVEENKFESFEDAENFFGQCGFEIFKKVETPLTKISSLKFLQQMKNQKSADIKNRKKTRETWILKVINA